MTCLALRISASSGLPLQPAKAAPCVLDLLGQARPRSHANQESTIWWRAASPPPQRPSPPHIPKMSLRSSQGPPGASRLTTKTTQETSQMSYVIAEPCIGQKDNSCVEVCPVDCIHPTPDEPDYDSVEQLYIDPDECIDCDACVEACPVDACFAEDQLPAEWAKYAEINAAYYKKAA